MIFKKQINIEKLNQERTHMIQYLDIIFTEVGNDYLCAKMLVNHKTQQPMGLLHGGASVVLAETLASTASNFCVDDKKQYCVGLDINANHICSIQSGFVMAKAAPLHLGKSTHVWEIKITAESSKLVCISRLTMAVMNF